MITRELFLNPWLQMEAVISMQTTSKQVFINCLSGINLWPTVLKLFFISIVNLRLRYIIEIIKQPRKKIKRRITLPDEIKFIWFYEMIFFVCV